MQTWDRVCVTHDPTVHGFQDAAIRTFTYVVVDDITREAVALDPVLTYDQVASLVSFGPVDDVLAFAARTTRRGPPRNACACRSS